MEKYLFREYNLSALLAPKRGDGSIDYTKPSVFVRPIRMIVEAGESVVVVVGSNGGSGTTHASAAAAADDDDA